MNIETLRTAKKENELTKWSWAITLGLVAALYAPLVLSNLWNWFVADAIHAASISYWHALGFLMIMAVLKMRYADESENNWKRAFTILEACVPDDKKPSVKEAIDEGKDSGWQGYLGTAVAKICVYTFLLGVGWGLRNFVM